MITSRTQINRSNGYALLFAVLVAAVVLGVGVSILNVSRKEILLTSGAEQSQYAFYAADAGYECAEYQDLVKMMFSSSSPSSFALNECGATYSGTTYAPTVTSFTPTVSASSSSGFGSSVYTFEFSVPVSNSGSCAAVTVTKTYKTVITDPITGSTTLTVATSILSDGFNVGWDKNNFTCDLSSATKVERALLINY